MAVLVEQTMPEDVPIELVEEVTFEMGVEDDPPAGLVVHVHFVRNGRVRIVDVWESAEAYEAFGRDRLAPAMQTAAERHGRGLDGPGPETSIVEVQGFVKG